MSHTLRRDLDEIIALLGSRMPGRVEAARGLAHKCRNTLDNSREVTEKVTTYRTPGEYLQYGDSDHEHFVVINHKARIVLDD